MSTNKTALKDPSALPAATPAVNEKMIADLNSLLTDVIDKERLSQTLTGLHMDYSKLIIRHVKAEGETGGIPYNFDNQLSFLRELINIFSGKFEI